eukprot:m.261751 g.261751  ORF g.261751 m.261751 type:complete len:140 (-) comp43053_c0_seq1:72-491(-)
MAAPPFDHDVDTEMTDVEVVSSVAIVEPADDIEQRVVDLLRQAGKLVAFLGESNAEEQQVTDLCKRCVADVTDLRESFRQQVVQYEEHRTTVESSACIYGDLIDARIATQGANLVKDRVKSMLQETNAHITQDDESTRN